MLESLANSVGCNTIIDSCALYVFTLNHTLCVCMCVCACAVYDTVKHSGTYSGSRQHLLRVCVCVYLQWVMTAFTKSVCVCVLTVGHDSIY